jgi:hypothetical protein
MFFGWNAKLPRPQGAKLLAVDATSDAVLDQDHVEIDQ